MRNYTYTLKEYADDPASIGPKIMAMTSTERARLGPELRQLYGANEEHFTRQMWRLTRHGMTFAQVSEAAVHFNVPSSSGFSSTVNPGTFSRAMAVTDVVHTPRTASEVVAAICLAKLSGQAWVRMKQDVLDALMTRFEPAVARDILESSSRSIAQASGRQAGADDDRDGGYSVSGDGFSITIDDPSAQGIYEMMTDMYPSMRFSPSGFSCFDESIGWWRTAPTVQLLAKPKGSRKGKTARLFVKKSVGVGVKQHPWMTKAMDSELAAQAINAADAREDSRFMAQRGSITMRDGDGYVTLSMGPLGEGGITSRKSTARDSPNWLVNRQWLPDGAPTPAFDHFMGTVFAGAPDEQLRKDLLLSWLGAAIMGCTHGGKWLGPNILVCYGAGGNGKSTILELLNRVAPSMCINASLDQLANDSVVAKLVGARILVAPEIGDFRGDGIDVSSRLKQLSDGEGMTVNEKYEKAYEVKETTCSIVAAVNRTPRFASYDGGIQRRLSFLEFPNRFNERSYKGDLMSDLESEIAGIVPQLLAAASDAIAKKAWPEPPSSARGVLRIATNSSSVYSWMSSVLRPPGYRSHNGDSLPVNAYRLKELYGMYCKWCDFNGTRYAHPMDHFISEMSESGVGSAVQKHSCGGIMMNNAAMFDINGSSDANPVLFVGALRGVDVDSGQNTEWLYSEYPWADPYPLENNRDL